VQCINNQIEIYDLESKEFIGYIPSYNDSLLTTFAFSADNNNILLGHNDGSIYRFNVEKVFLQPTELPPNYKVIPASDLVLNDGQGVGTGFGNGDGFGDGEHSSLNIMRIYNNNKNTLTPKIGLGILSFPFFLNISAGAEYKNATILAPFYFGGGVDFNIGLPDKDFPYKYSENNIIQANPIILGGKIYGSIGITFTPWFQDLLISFGLNIGGNISCLGYFPDNGYLITPPLLGVAAKLQAGAIIKGFEVCFAVNYDGTNKFYPEITMGYQIKLKQRTKEQNEAA